MTRLTPTTRGSRTLRCALVLVASAGAAAVLPAGVASADSKPAAAAQSPAIVGPLLQFFTFGSDVGIPTVCQAASSGIGSGAAYFKVAGQLAPVISAINNGCTTVQTQADTFIAAGNKYSAALAVWNPYVNPMIQQSADSVTQAGTDYGDAVAPFGPTIAGLGGTLNFFQGH